MIDYGYEYEPPRRRKQGGSFWVSFFTALFVAAGTSTAMHLWVLPKWKPASKPLAFNEVLVPSLMDRTLDQASTTLQKLGLQLKISGRQYHKRPMGTILAQIPSAGVRLKRGESVGVVISLGPTPDKSSPQPPSQPQQRAPRVARTPPKTALVTVPRLYHVSLFAAKKRIRRAGLKVGKIRYGADEDVGPLLILRQSPPPGKRVPRGTAVDLVVNKEDL